MPSKARNALDENLRDVERLLELHTEAGGNNPGRRLEVLNKSVIVLITACWEAYCEDIAEEALEFIVTHAESSGILSKEIKQSIAKELKDDKHELAVWKLADGNWKDVLRKRLQGLKENRNRNFSSAKAKKVDELFKSAIGLADVSLKWVWARELTAEKARKKLDKYVELRGEIAHRGKAQNRVTRNQVQDYLNFIKGAAAKTGGAVKQHVRSITNKELWEDYP